jgi:hypothetical protein
MTKKKHNDGVLGVWEDRPFAESRTADDIFSGILESLKHLAR